jgi:hypothetical protein
MTTYGDVGIPTMKRIDPKEQNLISLQIVWNTSEIEFQCWKWTGVRVFVCKDDKRVNW